MARGSGPSALLIRASNVEFGDIVRVAPNDSDWKRISFRVVRLRAGEHVHGKSGDDETALVVIGGTIDVSSSEGEWPSVGKRTDPFTGPPETVFLPASTTYDVTAATDAEVAICGAPATERHAARQIVTSADSEFVRGTGSAERRIRNIIMGSDEASALFLTEVITPPGNWSSYPPHKHDVDDPPNESQLEELYYYRARPAAGFAFQRIYSADGDLDETITAHDRDVVLVPRGYHVCAAAAGYWIYYLNVLAGPRHVYHMTFDPAHAWIKEDWTW
jgi:5-deoxy-glucuronate isomerase